MLIPYEALTPDTLRALCEEFVSRDGTQTGDLQEAAQKVIRLLESGRAVLSFDEEAEEDENGEAPSCQILLREEWEKQEAKK